MAKQLNKKELHKPESPPGVQAPIPKELVSSEAVMYILAGVAALVVVGGVYWVQKHFTLVLKEDAMEEAGEETDQNNARFSPEEERATLKSLTPSENATSSITAEEERQARIDLNAPESAVAPQSEQATGTRSIDDTEARGNLSREEYDAALESLQAP